MNLDPLNIPQEMPVMALSQAVLFPHALLPLHIFEEKYRRMLAWSLEHSRVFAIAQTVDNFGLENEVPEIAEVIGVGLIRACVAKPDGTSDLILHGLQRARVTGSVQLQPFRIIRIENFPTENPDPRLARSLAGELIQQSQALDEIGIRMPAQLSNYMKTVKDPEIIGDLLAAAFVENPVIRQSILEEKILSARLDLILTSMKALSS